MMKQKKSKKLRYYIMATIMILCASQSIKAAELTDFKTIVVSSPGLFTQLAVEELNRVFDPKMHVVNAIPKNKSGCIILEPDTSLKTDGYSIELKGKTVWIKGKNAGLLYGSYALLRHFGWEYYAPDCEKMPDMKRDVADFQESRVPDLSFRAVDFNFGEIKDYRTPFVMLRLGFSPTRYVNDPRLTSMVYAPFFEKDTYVVWHTNSLFAPKDKKVFQAHPELYAKSREGHQKGGSELYGITENMDHACGSNPHYREIVTEKVMKWLGASPSALAVPIGQGDGHAWCECPNCLALDPIPQPAGNMRHNMADRQLNLVNEIAKNVAQKYPDKKVILLVYAATTEPPVREVPEPNVILLFCPYPPYANCFSHGLDCPKNKKFLDLMTAWQRKFPLNTAWVFDYPMNYSNRFALFFPHDAMYSKIRYYGSNNISGVNLCGSPRLLDELFHFVVGRLMWDTRLDAATVKKLESEFLTAYYGPAAPAMTEYLALLRKHNVCQGIYSGRSELSNPVLIQEAYRILTPAAALQDIYGKRVCKELAGVIFTDLSHYAATLDPATRLRKLKEYCAITREQPPMQPSHTTDIAGWLKSGFGINVKIKPKPINRQWAEALTTPELKELDVCNTDAEFSALAQKLALNSVARQQVTETEIRPSLDGVVVQGVKNEVINYSGKPAVVIYGTESMSTTFEYESDKPFVDGKLILEALDHDKPDGKTVIEISVNGKVIFNGPNNASKEKYTALTFPIPDGLVKKGQNNLVIRNLSPTAPMGNWFIVSAIKISPSNSPWKIIVTNPKLKVGREKNIKAEIKSIPGQFELKMQTPGTNDYSLRAYYTIEGTTPNKNYRIRFLVNCLNNQTAFFTHILVKDWKGIGTITIPPISDAKRYEIRFKAKADVGNPQIWFSLGKLSAGAELTISNIVIEEQ